MNEETFLCLDSIAWSGLSSIATLLAVLVALFLPFIINYVRVLNVLEALKEECTFNNNQFKNMLDKKDAILNGEKIPRGLILAAYLVNLRTDIWQAHKTTLSENSPKNFSRYYDYYNRIVILKKNSTPSADGKLSVMSIHLVESQFDEFIERYKDNFI